MRKKWRGLTTTYECVEMKEKIYRNYYQHKYTRVNWKFSVLVGYTFIWWLYWQNFSFCTRNNRQKIKISFVCCVCERQRMAVEHGNTGTVVCLRWLSSLHVECCYHVLARLAHLFTSIVLSSPSSAIAHCTLHFALLNGVNTYTRIHFRLAIVNRWMNFFEEK